MGIQTSSVHACSIVVKRKCFARAAPLVRQISASSSRTSQSGCGHALAASLRQGNTEWKLQPASVPVLHRNGLEDGIPQQLYRRALDARHVVLPRGFPESVAPGYQGYTIWLATGLFAHSFTLMVSTNALLSGFFAEMSAASWLMKDLVPPLLAGSIASRITTLEANPKKWLTAACFANSVLGGVEFLVPHLLPKASWMALAICTNIGKMTGYLIIGASRAVLQKTLASRGDNLGEVTAKLGALGMLMHCFGAATALMLVHYLDFWGQLAAITAGAGVGFYAPVRASQCVVMPTVSTSSIRHLTSRWTAARGAALPWVCPSPETLHHELAARWSIAHSLAGRASTWRELLFRDSGILRAPGAVSLHISPALTSPDDVTALLTWHDGLTTAGIGVPSAWSLGACGEGKLLLLYSTNATASDVIEGFAVAWLTAHEGADTLCGGREVAASGLTRMAIASLPQWRRDAVALRDSMDAAGWQCMACCVDDVSRRVEWGEARGTSR